MVIIIIIISIIIGLFVLVSHFVCSIHVYN